MKYLIFALLSLLSLFFVSCNTEWGDVMGISDMKPSLKITSPAEMDTLRSDVQVGLKIHLLNTIRETKVFVNSVQVLSTGTTSSISLSINSFKRGINTISVKIIDENGNESDLSSVNIFIDKNLSVFKSDIDTCSYYNTTSTSINLSDLFDDDSVSYVKNSINSISPEGLIKAQITENKILTITPVKNPDNLDTTLIVIKGKLNSQEAFVNIHYKQLHSYYIASKSLYDALPGQVGNQYVSSVNQTTLNLSNKNITSIEGLEQYHELTYLNLSDNKISSLIITMPWLNELVLNNLPLKTLQLDCSNLQKLSLNNTMLQALTLDKTKKLLELSLVDVPIEDLKVECSYLGKIISTGSKFKSIDLSNCYYLTSIIIDNQYIETLNIKYDSWLNILQLYNTKIKSLDLVQKPGLNTITLLNNSIEEIIMPKEFQTSCSITMHNNKVKKLDFNANSSIMTIDLSSNELSEIYLGASKYSAIHLENNKLSTLTVSKNNMYQHYGNNVRQQYYLQNNNLSSLDLSQVEFELLNTVNNPNLKTIYISKYQKELLDSWGWDKNKYNVDSWTSVLVKTSKEKKHK